MINPYKRMSHPMWVRGLKQGSEMPENRRKGCRTLCGCVDLNTHALTNHAIFRSHPMWVRGLKQLLNNSRRGEELSHPMWVRGLKPRRESVGNAH